MCGILAICRKHCALKEIKKERSRIEALNMSKHLRHRGPEYTGIYQSEDNQIIMCHERLCIIDRNPHGHQPFSVNGVHWIMNSEIYNHEKIRQNEFNSYDIETTSDSVIPGYYYLKYGKLDKWMLNQLDGIFAGVIYNEYNQDLIIFRDAIGICPLYWGTDRNNVLYVASEVKAIERICLKELKEFKPGCIYRNGVVDYWYYPLWMTPNYYPEEKCKYIILKNLLIEAVKKRLMSDVEIGFLLSGGLDSSIIASIGSRLFKDNGIRIKTYSVGLKNSPDLEYARKLSNFLNTEHTEVIITEQEAIDAVSDVVYHLESFEQVRASVPMYLLCRKIKSDNIKVLLSGEGADELFGGYLYFHEAPSGEEFQKELVRKVSRLHKWDVMRANKIPFAWGIETRVPFLDKDFVEYVMNIDPEEKMCDMNYKPDGKHPKMEKYILRKCFEDYLPEDVLWRQKEQFSDGVGFTWVDSLKNYCEEMITDIEWKNREKFYPVNSPKNKEYYFLRKIFQSHFSNNMLLDLIPQEDSICCSTPEAIEWNPEWKNTHEISGRNIKIHNFYTEQ